MSIELKPCPFCGGEAEMMGDQYPYVECQGCAAGFTANHSYEFDEDDAASKWNARSNAGPNLKPIAESKVRQLGGDVCGVLVRTEDSEVMAVSEHGRCTRLDAGVMGPVEPAGMSERALFEQKFPAPQGVEWIDDNQGYRITSDDDYWWESEGQAHFRGYLGQWIGWQAARARGGQGADAVKWSDPAVDPIVSKLYRKFKEWNRQGFGADDVTWCEVRGYVAELLNTQPQPAKQGSAPHWKELEALADEYIEGYEFRGDEGDYQPTEQERFLIQDCVAGLMDEVHQMLKRATPQPAVPEGWKLVPIEPTGQMLKHGTLARTLGNGGSDKVYKAMIDAAPQPPKEGA